MPIEASQKQAFNLAQIAASRDRLATPAKWSRCLVSLLRVRFPAHAHGLAIHADADAHENQPTHDAGD